MGRTLDEYKEEYERTKSEIDFIKREKNKYDGVHSALEKERERNAKIETECTSLTRRLQKAGNENEKLSKEREILLE